MSKMKKNRSLYLLILGILLVIGLFFSDDIMSIINNMDKESDMQRIRGTYFFDDIREWWNNLLE